MKRIHEAAKQYADACKFKSDFPHHERSEYNGFLAGVEFVQRWIPVEEELPTIGEFVLAYNPKWVNEDFNPKGVRIGFQDPEGFVSAHYWEYQDCFVTISKLECEGNSEYSKEIQESTEPTHWRPINIEQLKTK